MEKNEEKQRGGPRPTNSQGQGQEKSPGIKKKASHLRTSEKFRDTGVSEGGERPKTEGQTQKGSSG